MAALLLVSVVLIFVMICFYYVELDNQLFAERSKHLQEITEKVADIFDITIARSWDSYRPGKTLPVSTKVNKFLATSRNYNGYIFFREREKWKEVNYWKEWHHVL